MHPVFSIPTFSVDRRLHVSLIHEQVMAKKRLLCYVNSFSFFFAPANIKKTLTMNFIAKNCCLLIYII